MSNTKARMASLILAGLLFALLESPVMADSVYDGWWFIQDKPGTGVSLEIRGNTMFAAIFTYEKGDPVWYSVAAARNPSDNTYSGTLTEWANNPAGPDGPLNARPGDAGSFRISFTAQDRAVLTYSVTGKTDELSAQLVRFMPVASPGAPDNRIKGWWYDPRMNGIGIFLEAQGGTFFGAWYMYHSQEVGYLPFWFSFSGSLGSGATTFSSPVTYWEDGSPLGVTPYKGPASFNAGGHQVSFTLKPDGGLDVSWNANGRNTIFHMVRFRF